MRLAADPEAALWIRDLVPDPDSFDWDMGNLGKSEIKHDVADEEIESLFMARSFAFAGRIIAPDMSEWRGLVLSETPQGRALALIFTRRGDRLRPISCRPMRAEERRIYAVSKTQA